MSIFSKLKSRKLTQEEKVLRILQDKGKYGATANDFINGNVHRFSQYIMVLRRQGYLIDSVRLKNNHWKYYLDK